MIYIILAEAVETVTSKTDLISWFVGIVSAVGGSIITLMIQASKMKTEKHKREEIKQTKIDENLNAVIKQLRMQIDSQAKDIALTSEKIENLMENAEKYKQKYLQQSEYVVELVDHITMGKPPPAPKQKNI